MRHTTYPGAAALLAVVCLCVCEASATSLEYVPPPWHNTSSTCAADPGIRRVHGGEVMTWRGRQYLVVASQLELGMAELRATGLAPLSWSRFGVPPYGDRDVNLFNFTVCDDCRYGAAGFDVQGLVLWDSGTGSGPILGESRRWVDSGTAGALTFTYGPRQYLIARVHADCQGDALVEITGIRPEDQRLVQCVTDGAGQPYTVDGGFWLPRDPAPGDPITGHVWLLDRQLGERVHAYTVRTVAGDPWLDAIGWVFRAGWLLDHGVDVDLARRIAVSAYSDGLSVWRIDDPAAPHRLSLTPLWAGVRAWGVELRWPYVWVGAMHTLDAGSTYLWDVSDPARPLSVDPGTWDPAQPWNSYPCSGNKGGTWDPVTDTLRLSRHSVGETFQLHTNPAAIFADGFESGNTAAWTAAQGE
jgi:hypothetical protein